jgi:hypothetical protein
VTLKVPGIFFLNIPIIGDVLKIFFSKRGSFYYFEGLCYSVQRKSFLLPDSSLFLINKIKGSIISFFFSYFYNLIFSVRFSDYKKKRRMPRSAKIYYVLRKASFNLKF